MSAKRPFAAHANWHQTLRPACVRTPAHTEAHFLTCYITLTIVRLIQLATKNGHSVEAMLGDPAKMC
ncbi:MAG: hypothetical protein RRX88_06185 [Raoultibacter sp.]